MTIATPATNQLIPDHPVGPETAEIARVEDVPPAGHGALRCDVNGTPIGLYRVADEIRAWRNVCPHEAAPVCRGPVTGTRLQSAVYEYTYGRDREVLRCPWHGWEFDLATGDHLAEGSGAKLRSHPIHVQDGRIYDASNRGLMHKRDLVVAEVDRVGHVLVLDLSAADGGSLPAWSPGAHIELALPSGRVRHYSLCGNPREKYRYRIAVLAEAGGRGGSRELHEIATRGACLRMKALRNRFPLRYAPHYLFIAGGIGITAILPMITMVARRGGSYQAVYIGRDQAGMPFGSELAAVPAVTMIGTSVAGRPEIAALVADLPAHTAIYCCGPESLTSAVRAAVAATSRDLPVHTERFTSTPVSNSSESDRPFEVTLARTGRTLQVPADDTLLNTLRRHGIARDSSCEQGWCGSCETTVVSGTPIHRDSILDADEHDDAGTMMICTSRATGTVVLDA
ncbi:2Fe-2S iron-sulfur cluster-binding protein [Ruania alba]|uniref:Ferredoxin-NADP reductase n=1 Tax=Ruania alba TaxID=648782 RepID=A0A1H5BVQ4_9MICO|nr:2Fe-2S iron-sulfur cluster-binding protein [Ruania alba]SED58475.1 Ferredoxin-NADP reductase [Ruania alba]